jgi:hypothetical protein
MAGNDQLKMATPSDEPAVLHGDGRTFHEMAQERLKEAA